ncbi:phage protease [Acinetobacter ursingii]|uniref:phage protease n=1 Tax=Acinetobacter ursingii TaxID=108980 RepID=UPI0021CD76F7|nr:phage protease [Acinetobacter ursingii]MCU4306999.1 phage protease [Acinetobacter ursingii]MCU4373246.1 phage protease [Acinetobacter ursingii]
MTDKVLVAPCSFVFNATDNQLVLVPEGTFSGVDGRPFDAPHWLLTPEKGRQIVAALNERKIDMVIDYEHATLKSQTNGMPAPAAGWLKSGSFIYVDGVGICSTQFEWLDKAKGFIESGEYKYLSPVLFYNKLGEVLALINVALTNTPALDQLPEAKLAAAAQEFFAQNFSQNHDEDSTMNEFLELMRKKLGLAETATEQEVMVAANSVFTKIDGAFGTTLAADQTLDAAIDKAIEVKAAANSQATPDPAKYVPMAVYQEAVAKAGNADAAVKAKEIDDLIVAACSDGRLTGDATINWVKDQAKTNPDFVKAHLEGLPKIAALTQKQTQQVNLAANHQGGNPQHTPEALAVAAQMGVDLGGNA